MILMKDIIREGHKTLSQKAKQVDIPLSNSDKNLLFDLLTYVIASQNVDFAEQFKLRPAVGIAAPQVNVSKRMFAMHMTDFDHITHSYALVNPKILSHSSDIIYIPGGEGCLSIDRETIGLTPRYDKITFEALSFDIKTKELTKIKKSLTGYAAIVFQHEYDHLDGIMYTEKLFDELPDALPAFEIDDHKDEIEIES